MKTCNVCKRERPLERFAATKNRKSGIETRCRDCVNAARNKRNEKRRDILNARSQAWRDANRELYRDMARAKYWRDPEAARERSRQWHEANPDKARARQKARMTYARENLTDYYIRHSLNLTLNQVTPELIELRRMQIVAKRLSIELKKATSRNEKITHDGING